MGFFHTHTLTASTTGELTSKAHLSPNQTDRRQVKPNYTLYLCMCVCTFTYLIEPTPPSEVIVQTAREVCVVLCFCAGLSGDPKRNGSKQYKTKRNKSENLSGLLRFITSCLYMYVYVCVSYMYMYIHHFRSTRRLVWPEVEKEKERWGDTGQLWEKQRGTNQVPDRIDISTQLKGTGGECCRYMQTIYMYIYKVYW